jgi:cell wall-associated NlpC family hydrolase
VTQDTQTASHVPTARDVLEVCVPATTLWARPDSPRAVDEPALAAEPDLAAWTAAMDARTRQELVGRALTQLLMGEPVHVLEERGGWAHVVAPLQPSTGHASGYPGWVRRQHLAIPSARPPDRRALVTIATTCCDLDDGSSTLLSFGTSLAVMHLGDDLATVVLPGDRTGRVPLGAVRLQGSDGPPPYRPDDVLEAASQFLGLRYLWGGTSAWGLDCSGLVHLVYRSLGVRVPRDAVDQAAWVDPLPLDAARPGDLYFFAHGDEAVSHVGFVSRTMSADGRPWLLHAPESGGVLEERPLAPHRRDTLVSAGRVRTHDDAGQATGSPRA